MGYKYLLILMIILVAFGCNTNIVDNPVEENNLEMRIFW